MPSKNPPHKQNKSISADRHRLKMLELALSGYDHFKVSDLELKREGMTYSSDTFRILKEQFTEDRFYLIIGGDSLMQLDSWHEPEELFRYAPILATSRKDIDRSEVLEKTKHYVEDMGADILFFDTPDLDISSSDIRERVMYGRTVRGLVSPGVYEYIREQGLYQDYRFQSIKRILKEELKASRYEHTIGVAKTAFDLALAHGCDPQRAYLAGLLHDCGKAVRYSDQIATAEELGVELTDVEKAKPGALAHAKIGAKLAHTRFGVSDEEIRSAIEFHTTGKPDMTLLEKIIFVADYIEPGREIPSDPPLSVIRLTALTDLDRAVYLELSNMIRYLKNIGDTIDQMTIRTLEFYESKL